MPSATVPHIFDQSTRLLRYRRAKALRQRGGSANWLDGDMIEDFLDRIDFMNLSAGSARTLGHVSASLNTELSKRGFDVVSTDLGAFDEEQIWPIQPADYIFAMRTLSTLNDVPGALLHIRHALSEGGIMFAQILGAGSLPTLREIMLAADGDRPAARIHPQIDNQAASALLARAGFSKQVVDSRTLTVRFSSFERMVADLREQALTGILADRPPPLSRRGLERAREAFETRRDADGKVAERFEILALTGWR
ncbi:hypothetical protein [Erythrobacter sp. YT30]|uniref:hypothetical protein n=1 Tax=Erythrobacter sp. YT30 TaxID=1735012 RepID=UPI00076CB36D|nr:hypothetical protein [Erythrobacter sp. YT30]KWV92937.1 hypothetical protein AUC45_01980 [Erythrobacter sp. YT30]